MAQQPRGVSGGIGAVVFGVIKPITRVETPEEFLELTMAQLGNFITAGFKLWPGFLAVWIMIFVIFWAGRPMPWPLPFVGGVEDYLNGIFAIGYLALVIFLGGFALQEDTYKIGGNDRTMNNKGLLAFVLAGGGFLFTVFAMKVSAGKVATIPMIFLGALQVALYLLPSESLKEQGRYEFRKAANAALAVLALWIIAASGSLNLVEF